MDKKSRPEDRKDQPEEAKELKPAARQSLTKEDVSGVAGGRPPIHTPPR
ncbi:MAG: hypothetical protein J6S63_10410 [Atopobiaceae bacterium]|nr:hypothetical protein [Atopobiaceae bacterium]